MTTENTLVTGDTVTETAHQTVAQVVADAADPQRTQAAATEAAQTVSDIVRVTVEGGAPVLPKPPTTPMKPPRPKHVTKPVRKAPTDDEVKAKWRRQLEESGLFEGAILDLLPDYAVKHRGFDPSRSWGGVLVSMVIRLATQLKELPAFSSADADEIFRTLQSWLIDLEDVIGAGPDDWNTRFQSSAAQRDAVNEYFGIGGSLHTIPKSKLGIMTVRRAAWPSRIEGEKKIGGTFADRFNYLVLAIVNLSMVPDLEMWSKVYHARTVTKPAWVIDEGGSLKCRECGEPVTVTPTGAYRCTGLTCPNRFGSTTVSLEGFDGTNAKMSDGGAQQKRQWNNAPKTGGAPKRDGFRRKDESDKDEARFERKPGKKHKKYHINNDDDAGVPTGSASETGGSFSSVPSNLSNLGDAFSAAGL